MRPPKTEFPSPSGDSLPADFTPEERLDLFGPRFPSPSGDSLPADEQPKVQAVVEEESFHRPQAIPFLPTAPSRGLEKSIG